MADTQATTLIKAAQTYANQMVTAAETSMGDALGAVEWAREPSVIMAWANLPEAPEKSAELSLPTLSDVTLDIGTAPESELTFQDIADIDAGEAPTLQATAPTLTIPSTPSQLAAFLTVSPRIETDVVLPDAPDLIAPEDVGLVEHTVPDAPVVTLPTFNGYLPSSLPSAPTNLAAQVHDAYRTNSVDSLTLVNDYVDWELDKINPDFHVQMARLEVQLAKYLEGGTGLKPEVEEAIYNRARARNEFEAKKVQDAAFADAAARGFTLPSGALTSALARARQDAANNANKTSNEILIAQAEMEQKNLQFAVTTSTGLRVAMVNASLGYMQNLATLNGQALDYAKTVLGAVVEVYNAGVKAYSARLDAYRAEAAVYEAQVRGALGAVEVYKAEIQALEALTNVDQAKVAIYRARVDTMNAKATAYKTQVEAVVSVASLEKLKLDLFQAQVQAYGTQVQAKTAEWQGYAAAIGGEEAKVRAYSSQVQGYVAQVQGYSSTIAAKTEAVKAAALTNDARAKQYVAQWQGYQTEVQAKGEVARTKIENQRQEILAFQAQAQAQVAQAQIGMEYYKATGQISVENARLIMQSSVADVEAKSKYLGLLGQLHTANATVHANLAGAAMAGMNALAVEYAQT